MNTSLEPVSISERTLKNFWQEYRVYPDRLELQSWISFHTIVIPFRNLESLEIRPPFCAWDLFRGKSFLFAFPLKLDAADLYRNIALKRTNGLFRYLRFTPDDPDKFVTLVESLTGTGVVVHGKPEE